MKPALIPHLKLRSLFFGEGVVPKLATIDNGKALCFSPLSQDVTKCLSLDFFILLFVIFEGPISHPVRLEVSLEVFNVRRVRNIYAADKFTD